MEAITFHWRGVGSRKLHIWTPHGVGFKNGHIIFCSSPHHFGDTLPPKVPRGPFDGLPSNYFSGLFLACFFWFGADQCSIPGELRPESWFFGKPTSIATKNMYPNLWQLCTNKKLLCHHYFDPFQEKACFGKETADSTVFPHKMGVFWDPGKINEYWISLQWWGVIKLSRIPFLLHFTWGF